MSKTQLTLENFVKCDEFISLDEVNNILDRNGDIQQHRELYLTLSQMSALSVYLYTNKIKDQSERYTLITKYLHELNLIEKYFVDTESNIDHVIELIKQNKADFVYAVNSKAVFDPIFDWNQEKNQKLKSIFFKDEKEHNRVAVNF